MSGGLRSSRVMRARASYSVLAQHAKDNEHEEEENSDGEADLGDPDSACRNCPKTQKSSDQGDDKKRDCPSEHCTPPLNSRITPRAIETWRLAVRSNNALPDDVMMNETGTGRSLRRFA